MGGTNQLHNRHCHDGDNVRASGRHRGELASSGEAADAGNSDSAMHAVVVRY